MSSESDSGAKWTSPILNTYDHQIVYEGLARLKSDIELDGLRHREYSAQIAVRLLFIPTDAS
jgi:hypothetical protein